MYHRRSPSEAERMTDDPAVVILKSDDGNCHWEAWPILYLVEVNEIWYVKPSKSPTGWPAQAKRKRCQRRYCEENIAQSASPLAIVWWHQLLYCGGVTLSGSWPAKKSGDYRSPIVGFSRLVIRNQPNGPWLLTAAKLCWAGCNDWRDLSIVRSHCLVANLGNLTVRWRRQYRLTSLWWLTWPLWWLNRVMR